MNERRNLMLLGILALLLITGCQSDPTETSQSATQTSLAPPTLEGTGTTIPLQPSETPLSLTALVNGEVISEAEYQAELARYRAAVGTEMATADEQYVLQELIDQLLMAQAAEKSGFIVDEAMVQSWIEQLDIGEQALQDWLSEHDYTDASFRATLARSIAAAWMRDQVIADVPKTAEQVHARQVLLYNSEEADGVFGQLEAGADFETLAEQYDPLTKGDLGWFPRGYLTVPELDDVVFNLAPGEHSPVIQTILGYHILQLVEKDVAHPLTPNTYRVVQTQALVHWLQDLRDQSEIIIYSP